MHDYEIRMPIRYNRELSGKEYDIDQFLTADKGCTNEYQILDTQYSMYLNLSRLSDTTNIIKLAINFYDEDVNEYDLTFIKTLFENEGQCKTWIKNHVNLYLENINSKSIKINYCEAGGHVSFHRLYVPIFDFTTGTKLDIPEVKSVAIVLELPDLDRYIK